jgi:hypothetical protein
MALETPPQNRSKPGQRPLGQTLLGAAMVIGVLVLGALVLYLITHGLLLVLDNLFPG